jgi:hypothetical protein
MDFLKSLVQCIAISTLTIFVTMKLLEVVFL